MKVKHKRGKSLYEGVSFLLINYGRYGCHFGKEMNDKVVESIYVFYYIQIPSKRNFYELKLNNEH